ncbi:MAG: type II secretion system protein N [Magnetococcales bacterium]|nr:type II secretion system protein N [Magnetococcales bacterium]
MNRLAFWLLGLGCFVFFLLAGIPANVLTGPVSQMTPIRLHGVSGTIWSGHVARVTAPEGIEIPKLSWDFKALSLLRGTVAVAFSTGRDNWHGEGEAGWSPWAGVVLRDLLLNADLSKVRLPNLPAEAGLVDGRVEQLRLDLNGMPRSGKGRVEVEQLRLPTFIGGELGSFVAELGDREGGGVRVRVKDKESPLDLQVTVEVDGQGIYRVEGGMAARDARSRLGELVKQAGPPGPDGRIPIRESGNLAQLLK